MSRNLPKIREEQIKEMFTPSPAGFIYSSPTAPDITLSVQDIITIYDFALFRANSDNYMDWLKYKLKENTNE